MVSGIRLSDDVPTSLGDYDMIMPTIEFHPSHAHNTDGNVIPQSLWSQSIFWVVDNEDHLALAADMHPYGIVSNSPKNILILWKVRSGATKSILGSNASSYMNNINPTIVFSLL